MSIKKDIDEIVTKTVISGLVWGFIFGGIIGINMIAVFFNL